MFDKIKSSKKVWIPLVVFLACILAFAIIFPIIYCTVLKVDLNIAATQIEDSQKFKLEWDTSKPIDKMTIKVYHNSDLIRMEETTQLLELISGEKEIDGIYGKLTIKVEAKKGIYLAKKTVNVNLSADEYNIAPITATMPVTMFSLALDEITDNGRIPTFVWLKRSGAWNWNNVPNNVYPLPIADTSEFLDDNEKSIYKKTSAYVKELYEINKNSKFHLYYNDYFNYGWVQATIANGIPTENYNVVMLSDGTASFSYFNKHFDNSNAETEYARMAAQWAKLKKQVAKKGTYTVFSNVEIKAEKLREYAFVMAREESNVEWWLTRINGTLANNNPDFYAKVEATENIKVRDLKGLLDAIPTDNDAYFNVDKLKKLYKFSDNMFEKAVEQDKEIMVILGTWTDTENNTYFEQYVKATMAYYGDDYVYYYKGHPKNPTNSVKGKLERLESWGLIDIDSTIPAELIFFFNPEAFCSGFASTTFVSLTKEKSCALFNAAKNNFGEAYKDNMEIFMRKAIVGEYGVVTSDKSFILEFNDTTKYDIAVYNADKNKLNFYKLNEENSKYEEVSR